MTEYTVLEVRAAKLAQKAHHGTERKYSIHRPLPPYIVHPAAVADIVRSVGGTTEMLASAWLHDVVEDCNISLDEIRFELTPRIAELVESLTDVAKKEDGNRAVRVAMNRDHSISGDAESQTIKMADGINNSYRIWDLAPSSLQPTGTKSACWSTA